MLKNLSPLLTPPLLFGLSKMGHGDWLAVVDANFPAHRVAEESGVALVELPGISTTQVLTSILSVFPVDTFENPSAVTMQMVDQPTVEPQAVTEFKNTMSSHGEEAPLAIERYAFYDLARQARLVVQTGDLRKYANILLRKGVISVD